MKYYAEILHKAEFSGYKFVTLSEFVDLGFPSQNHFIIRHDIDKSPESLNVIIDVERNMNAKSTCFVRVAGSDYNPIGYKSFNAISNALKIGCEIGLHTGFIEFAKINSLNPEDVLSSELKLLRTFFQIDGIAPHRDINYLHNSLPEIDERWEEFSKTYKLKYHAYDKKILESTTYVNEGFNPHLCWRTLSPYDAINDPNKKSIYMLTHPHWWYKIHPFETTQ